MDAKRLKILCPRRQMQLTVEEIQPRRISSTARKDVSRPMLLLTILNHSSQAPARAFSIPLKRCGLREFSVSGFGDGDEEEPEDEGEKDNIGRSEKLATKIAEGRVRHE